MYLFWVVICISALVRGALYAIYDPFKQVRIQWIFGSFYPFNFATKFEWSNEGLFPGWLFAKEFISLENIACLMVSFRKIVLFRIRIKRDVQHIIFIFVHRHEYYNNFACFTLRITHLQSELSENKYNKTIERCV